MIFVSGKFSAYVKIMTVNISYTMRKNFSIFFYMSEFSMNILIQSSKNFMVVWLGIFVSYLQLILHPN